MHKSPFSCIEISVGNKVPRPQVLRSRGPSVASILDAQNLLFVHRDFCGQQGTPTTSPSGKGTFCRVHSRCTKVPFRASRFLRNKRYRDSRPPTGRSDGVTLSRDRATIILDAQKSLFVHRDFCGQQGTPTTSPSGKGTFCRVHSRCTKVPFRASRFLRATRYPDHKPFGQGNLLSRPFSMHKSPFSCIEIFKKQTVP